MQKKKQQTNNPLYDDIISLLFTKVLVYPIKLVFIVGIAFLSYFINCNRTGINKCVVFSLHRGNLRKRSMTSVLYKYEAAFQPI